MAGEVRVSDAASFLNVVEGEDLAGEVGFDDVLEHGEHGLFKHAAARFEVGIDVARVRGILPPGAELQLQERDFWVTIYILPPGGSRMCGKQKTCGSAFLEVWQ